MLARSWFQYLAGCGRPAVQAERTADGRSRLCQSALNLMFGASKCATKAAARWC